MGIWVVVFVTVGLLGSVLWVMPTPREKALTDMRSAALGMGLKVRLSDQKLANALFPWLADYRGYVLYEKALPLGQQIRSPKAKVIRLSENPNAHEIDGFDPLLINLRSKGILNNLPSTAEALIFASSGVSLLWKEQRDIKDVSLLNDCLLSCLREVDGYS